MVNSVADHDDGGCTDTGQGDCTLREAIIMANEQPGADSIRFDELAFPRSGSAHHRLGSTRCLPLRINYSTGAERWYYLSGREVPDGDGLTLAADEIVLYDLRIEGFLVIKSPSSPTTIGS